MASDMDGVSKGFLGLFGLLIGVSGLASIVYGALLLIRYMAITYNFGFFSLYATAITLIIVGGLLIITLVLGMMGALRGMASLRMATLLLAFLLFVTLAVIGVWAMVIVKTGRLQNSILTDFSSLRAAKDSQLDEVRKLKLDYLSKNYNCCGSYNTYAEYTAGASATGGDLPESCCVTPGELCSKNPVTNSENRFRQGCGPVYYATKSKATYHTAILALICAGAVLLGLILYGLLVRKARADYASVSQ